MPRVRPKAQPLSAHSLLRLVWLASPALPVGGFSYSEGLEAAVDAGRVRDEAQAGNWIADQLRLMLGRSELPVMAAAMTAWRRGDLAQVAELQAWVCATRETQEFRLQSEQMGRSLAVWLANWDGDDALTRDPRVAQLAALQPSPTWSVAMALAMVMTAAPAREALLTVAFGWCENMVQAAIKAVPLGQTAGQRMLSKLAQAVPDVVDAALRLSDSERQAYTPMLAILSARHETQYSRLFRS